MSKKIIFSMLLILTAYCSKAQLYVTSGETITVSTSGDLVLQEDLNNNGTITNLTIGGANALNISGTGTINFLILNKSTGTATGIGGMQSITGTITPTAGTMNAGGFITLISNVSGTASVTTFPASGAAITGTLIMQRYIAGGRRVYRFLGHPFTSAIALSQLTPSIDITGSGGNGNGFTTTLTNTPSAFYYNNSTGSATAFTDVAWTGFTTANATNWSQYQGIRVIVRGAKGEGLNGRVYTPSAATISMGGAINMGNQVVTVTKGATNTYSLIGNPYPSAIDLNLATRGSNIGANFYVWDPRAATKGAYATNPFGSSYILPSSSAFFVTNIANTNNTITFHETDKSSGAGVALYGLTEHKYLQLQLSTDTISWDRLLIEYDAKSSPLQDYKDAAKLHNPDVDFYTMSSDSVPLAIDARPFSSNPLPIGVRTVDPQNFTITVADMPDAAATKNIQLFLHDKLMDSYKELKTGVVYDFATTPDTLATAGMRFEIIQKQAAIIAAVDNTNTEIGIQLSPNPVQNTLTIKLGKDVVSNTTVTNVTIIGVDGQQLQTVQAAIGATSIKVQLSAISKGLLLVVIKNDKVNTVLKLVKE